MPYKDKQPRLQAVFNRIKQRCRNKNTFNYKNYGGRGIKCLWISYQEFKNDMEKEYRKHIKKFGQSDTQIDRIDNNGNYCKENCRWVTKSENQLNTRRSKANRICKRCLEFKEFRDKGLGWRRISKLTGIPGSTIAYHFKSHNDYHKK